MSVHPGSIWLDNNWDTLPKGFWVAANNDGIVTQDRDLPNVYTDLNRRNTATDQVAIAFIPTDTVIQ